MLQQFLASLTGQQPQNQLSAAGQRGSAMDVWAGRADEGVASNGDILRRLPDGNIERVSAQYGHRVVTPPDETPNISGAMPQPAHQAARMQAAPDQMAQAGPAAPPSSGGQGGGFLQSLFGGGQQQKVNQTVDWLQKQGLDAGTAAALAQNPPLLQDFLKQRMRPQEPRNRSTTTIDGKLIDTNTGEVIGDYGSPNAAPRPITTAERQQWGIPEEDNRPYAMTPEGPKLIGGSGVTINNNAGAKGETKYDETVGTGYGNRFLEIQNEAQSAQRALNSFAVMEQMMSDPGFYSGVGAETAVRRLKQFGAAIGVDGTGIDSIETFNAMSKQSALDAMGGSLGAGFSNADRDFVIDQVPNLGNTIEGNRQLIGIQRKISERKLQIAQLARDYADQNSGRIDPGFDAYLAEWAEQNPLFPPPPPAPEMTEEQYLDQRYREELSRPRAVNPDTGEVLEWDGAQWQKAGGASAVAPSPGLQMQQPPAPSAPQPPAPVPPSPPAPAGQPDGRPQPWVNLPWLKIGPYVGPGSGVDPKYRR